MEGDRGLVVGGDGRDAAGAEGFGFFGGEALVGVLALVVVDERGEGKRGK